MFNEIINDYLSTQVCEAFEKMGVKVSLNDATPAKTVYSYGFDIFVEFIERHKEAFVKCKLAADGNAFAYRYFGKENLETLFGVAEEYVEKKMELIHELMENSENREKVSEISEKMKQLTSRHLDPDILECEVKWEASL